MKQFWNNIRCLLMVHVVALLVFSVMRWLLYVTIPYEFGADVSLAMKLHAFVLGVWFDNVIACYVMVIPLSALCVCSLFSYAPRWLYRSVTIWFAVLYAICFGLSAANIPYFCYFFQNINSSIFQWFGYAGTTAGMVVGESSYWAPIAYGLIAIVGFTYFLIRIKWLKAKDESQITNTHHLSSITQILCSAVLIGACVFGIRGRMGYNPIKVSQAYFCNDPFLNQLGISPTFNLLTSVLDDQRPENQRLSLMDDDEAVHAVQQILGRKGISGVSPIATKVRNDSAVFAGRPNVVIILMESMSASLIKSLDGKKELTPFLDELWHKSWSFENMYSAGNHTNHGMYATLFSWPAIMFRNLMKGTVIPHYDGLPTVLHDNGYHNFFFMTHESQYDNMNGFFRTNGFDEIYAQENYPKDKVVNSFGVQDDFLYDYATKTLTKYSTFNIQRSTFNSTYPFFSVLLSISNHPPYVIPAYFHPKSKVAEEQIVEYADWSLRKFFTEAQKQPWYKNTVFVLLGDHGKLMSSPECELPESYNHIPLIIYKEGITPHLFPDYALQEDVSPTLLSLLGISYTQNNFGIDLMHQHRDCVFYTGDKIVAARDHQHLYLYNPTEKTEMCYRVLGRDRVVKTTSASDKRFAHLKHYVFSMLQCAEKLVGEKKTVVKR